MSSGSGNPPLAQSSRRHTYGCLKWVTGPLSCVLPCTPDAISHIQPPLARKNGGGGWKRRKESKRRERWWRGCDRIIVPGWLAQPPCLFKIRCWKQQSMICENIFFAGNPWNKTAKSISRTRNTYKTSGNIENNFRIHLNTAWKNAEGINIKTSVPSCSFWPRKSSWFAKT